MRATAELRAGGDVRQPRVLIVEDQDDLRQLYVQHLSISGFDVIEAANGAEAIERVSSEQPDARTSHIPVVALTAHDGSGELERATSAGCDWFVPKPCPPAALITELRRVLRGEIQS